jgi:CRISPR-associated protein Cas2
MKRYPVIFAYDISNNKNRYRVRKTLKEWSLGNQKSVYECRLSMGEAVELFLQLNDLLNHKKDQLIMARIEPHRKLLCRGIGKSRMCEVLWIVS